ncbi:MAG: chemotaxis protein CheX [candidate division Zixibacteria bacterium]|nr:chemotaxis protein CheX [candidate division Zixibacteria bacterium]
MNSTFTKSRLSPDIVVQSFENAILAVLSSISDTDISIVDRQSYPKCIPSTDYYGEAILDGVLKGQVCVAINEPAARFISAKLAMAQPPEIDEDVTVDGVKETLNQICGKFRTILGEFEGKIEFSIPAVSQETVKLLPGIYDKRLTQLTVVKLNNHHVSILLLASYQA